MKRALALNALLGVVAAGLAGYVTWEAVRPASEPRPARAREAAPVTLATSPAAPEMPAIPGAYGIIATRNLFSPNRSDALATATSATPAVQVPKPNLFGVVLRDGAPMAYLEDPVTKRVAGYRIGDAVAGGTLKSIDADRVVLTRPEGTVDVRLHDPAKPRPSPSVGAPVPGSGPLPPAMPQLPGVIPPVTPQPSAPVPPQVQGPMPPAGPVPPAVTPGRRPLPPNLLRRFQQNQPGNAPTE
jgi:Type II secretion system protein C